VLLALSATAYLLFYYNYVPHVGLSRKIHLQYADGPFPHATAHLTSSSSYSVSSLISLQPYDITIHLHLPRTPTNLAAGNFMLDLSLISPPSTPEQPLSISSVLAPGNTTTLLARSRRPAILPYQSLITFVTHAFLSLPLHSLSLRDIDATTLSIPMFEQETFARGWRNLPASASLEIRTQPHTQAALLGQPIDAQQPVPLQVYSASIEFHARFRGLRWLMYNWRVSSFLLFTSGFYCVALISTGVAWGVTTLFSTSSLTARTAKEEEQRTIKRDPQGGVDLKPVNGHTTRSIKNESLDEESGESGEESGLSFSNLSDNATTFPTFARQMPVRYPMQPSLKHNHTSGSGSTSNRVKREGGDDDETGGIEAPAAAETLAEMTAGELAGDEEEREELDGVRGRGRDRDSGIGTSMEESAREVAGLQRRRGGRGGGGGSDLR
jgi:seipin